MVIRLIILFFANLLFISLSGYAQDSAQALTNAQKNKYLAVVGSKTKRMSRSIDNYTSKAINRVIGKERKLKKIVMRFNPVLGKKLFDYSLDSLSKMKTKIKNGLGEIVPSSTKNYYPYLDTLKQSISFIEKTGNSSLSSMNDSLNGLEGKFAKVEKLQEFLDERQKLLQENLKQIPGISKYLKNINKDINYFSEQINEYKCVFSERGKIEKLVASSLSKIPAFQNFMKQNSILAGLFPFNGSPSPANGNIPIVNGIPARVAIQQSQLVNSANISQFARQNAPSPEAVMSKLKNKVNSANGDNNQSPKFTPNSQRTKSFWKRIEYGTDIQFAKSSTYFPSTTDIALKIGYKLNDKSTITTGVAYKLGLGSGWNKIKFTHQGIGSRSSLDWKMKANFYLQGGFEMNYNNHFKNIDELKDHSGWQPSTLLGLVKKFKLSKKIKGSVQVLYDFLHKRNIPNTQPFVFRFGYGLK